MVEKVKEIQEYLKERGIIVAETSIVNAAINIATRWGGKTVFICEFEKGKKMTKEEGIPFDGIPVHIRERVYCDIREASMCWENPEGCGVFNTESTARISFELCQFILNEIEKAQK